MKKKWWHDKIAYQIYPKSFQDSNGDGIGDIRGIIQKLDYLQNLGVEAIYMNPIFVSPSNHKYDVQDYDYVDPHLGKQVVKKGELLEKKEKNNKRRCDQHT